MYGTDTKELHHHSPNGKPLIGSAAAAAVAAAAAAAVANSSAGCYSGRFSPTYRTSAESMRRCMTNSQVTAHLHK